MIVQNLIIFSMRALRANGIALIYLMVIKKLIKQQNILIHNMITMYLFWNLLLQPVIHMVLKE